MNSKHSYRMGAIKWNIELNDDCLRVRSMVVGDKTIPLRAITKTGFAAGAYDSRAVSAISSVMGASHSIRVGDNNVEIPPGPAGCVLAYTDARGRRRVDAFTFDPGDSKAISIVGAIVNRDPGSFVGIGSTLAVRRRMGVGGRDFLLGVAVFAVLASIIALLMWMGVLK